MFKLIVILIFSILVFIISIAAWVMLGSEISAFNTGIYLAVIMMCLGAIKSNKEG